MLDLLNKKFSFFELFTYNIPLKKTPVPQRIFTEEEIKQRWDKKKGHIRELANNIRSLRVNTTKELSSENEKEALVALAVQTMLITGERVGNDDSAKNGHHGVTGLLKSHVKVSDGHVKLTYTAKSGVAQEKSFTDERIASALKRAIKNSPSDHVFETSDGFKINAEKINRYLKEYNIRSKDIRGYSANKWVIQKLNENDIPKEEKERKKLLNKILKKVSQKVGHGTGTLKKHYLVPELAEQYVTKGKIIDLQSLGYRKGGRV